MAPHKLSMDLLTSIYRVSLLALFDRDSHGYFWWNQSLLINSNDQVWQHKVSIKKYVCCKFRIFVLLNQLLLISLKHFCCCHGWSKFTVALRYARKFLLWDNCINTPMIWKKQKLAKQHPHTAVGSIILMVFLIILTHPRGEEERPKNPHTKYRALILRVCPTPEGKRQNPGNKLPLHNSLLRVFTWAKIMFFFNTWSLSHMSPAVLAGCLYWYHNLNASL